MIAQIAGPNARNKSYPRLACDITRCRTQSPTGCYDLLLALGSASCHITHRIGGTICYRHWAVQLVISHTRQGVRFVKHVGSWVLHLDITHDAGGTICYGHWGLRLVISHTRQGGTICNGHWVLRLVISRTKQRVRFSFRSCVLHLVISRYHTRDRGYDLFRALCSASCDITHETRGTIGTMVPLFQFKIPHQTLNPEP